MVDDIVVQYVAACGEVWRAAQRENVRLVNAAYDVAEDLRDKMTSEQISATVKTFRDVELLIDERLRNR